MSAPDNHNGQVESAGALRPLLDLCIIRLMQHDSDIARTLVGALRDIPEHLVLHQPDASPCAAKLPDLSLATDPLLMQLGRSFRQLSWRTPGFGRLPPRLTDNMAVNELIGPTGQIIHETVRFGFLFQGESVSYPDHSHAAEELYLILKGAAEWQIDGRQLGIQRAGQFLHHLPWQSHAMQTEHQSMLSMWGWVGDIGMRHYRLA